MKRYLPLLVLLMHSWLFGVATTDPVTISIPGITNSPPQVAVANNGNAVAIWTNSSSNEIFASFFNAQILPFATAWTTPVVIAVGSAPRVAIDQSGNALIVFVTVTTNQINAVRFDVGAMTFSAPVLVSSTGGVNLAPEISMNDAGVALIVWIQTPYQVLASSFNPTTMAFSTPVIFLNNINPAEFELDNFNAGVAVYQEAPTLEIKAARISVP